MNCETKSPNNAPFNTPPPKGVLTFQGESEQERESWLRALSKAISGQEAPPTFATQLSTPLVTPLNSPAGTPETLRHPMISWLSSPDAVGGSGGGVIGAAGAAEAHASTSADEDAEDLQRAFAETLQFALHAGGTSST